MKSKDYLEEMVHHYLVCALWSSTDTNDGTPLDKYYSIEDISLKGWSEARQDCADFYLSNCAAILADKLTPKQCGYDFWLDRNGHGTGFRDRNIPHGQELSSAARVYGAVCIDQFLED